MHAFIFCSWKCYVFLCETGVCSFRHTGQKTGWNAISGFQQIFRSKLQKIGLIIGLIPRIESTGVSLQTWYWSSFTTNIRFSSTFYPDDIECVFLLHVRLTTRGHWLTGMWSVTQTLWRSPSRVWALVGFEPGWGLSPGGVWARVGFEPGWGLSSGSKSIWMHLFNKLVL